MAVDGEAAGADPWEAAAPVDPTAERMERIKTMTYSMVQSDSEPESLDGDEEPSDADKDAPEGAWRKGGRKDERLSFMFEHNSLISKRSSEVEKRASEDQIGPLPSFTCLEGGDEVAAPNPEVTSNGAVGDEEVCALDRELSLSKAPCGDEEALRRQLGFERSMREKCEAEISRLRKKLKAYRSTSKQLLKELEMFTCAPPVVSSAAENSSFAPHRSSTLGLGLGLGRRTSGWRAVGPHGGLHQRQEHDEEEDDDDEGELSVMPMESEIWSAHSGLSAPSNRRQLPGKSCMTPSNSDGSSGGAARGSKISNGSTKRVTISSEREEVRLSTRSADEEEDAILQIGDSMASAVFGVQAMFSGIWTEPDEREGLMWDRGHLSDNLGLSEDGFSIHFAPKHPPKPGEDMGLQSFAVTEDPVVLADGAGFGFEVRLDSVRSWGKNEVAIGLTWVPPRKWPSPLPDSADMLGKVWLAGYEGEAWGGESKTWVSVAWRLPRLLEGDRLAVTAVFGSRRVEVSVNSCLIGVIDSPDIRPDVPLWGVLDLLGQEGCVEAATAFPSSISAKPHHQKHHHSSKPKPSIINEADEEDGDEAV